MGRKEQFSYEGLEALFEYLEGIEEQTDCEIELDVIALCCEYREGTINEILSYYDLETLDELIDRTTVIFVDDLSNWKDFDMEKDGDKLIIIGQF